VIAAVGVEDGGLAPASLAVTVVSVEELPKMDAFGSCDTQNVTQFTCFTSTKVAVQTLTPGELQVSVEELPKTDTFGSCDTYVKIRIGNAALQTQIVTAGEVRVQKYLHF